MPRRLDLACGVHCAPGFEGVDISPCHADVKHVVDLMAFPWPWADQSVSELRCVHYIEHVGAGYWTPRVSDPRVGDVTPFQRGHLSVDLLMKFFAECHRVLEPGGVLTVECPQAHNNRAYQDPTHRRFIVPETFFYLSAEWRRQMGLEHGSYGVSCDFSFSIDHTFPEAPSKEIEMLMRTQGGRQIVASRDRERWNVTEDLRVRLVKMAAAAGPVPSPTASSGDEMDALIAQANARAAIEEAEALKKVKLTSTPIPQEQEEPHLFRVARAPGGMVVFDGNLQFPGQAPRSPEVVAFPDPTPEEVACSMPSKGGSS